MKRKRLLCAGALVLAFALMTGAGLQIMSVREGSPALSDGIGGTLIIDAGHGGEDGGAVSSAGTVESGINLAIALRLDAIMGLYGVDTLLTRTEDISLHDPGCTTLREKKVSDIHNRVAIIEGTPNATVISIHQNTYPSPQYSGAQVFYASSEDSQAFAAMTQENLRLAVDPENDRQAAAIPESVYLMNHISCRAILVECGFLSNPAEDALLVLPSYQTKLATALAVSYLQFQNQREGESLNGAQS